MNYRIINRMFVLLLCSSGLFAQKSPYNDVGFGLSYNYSQRHIPNYEEQKPIQFPTLDFKKILNFKNNISLKSGVSIFVTGHKSRHYYDYYNGVFEETKSVYGYLRFPILISYNINRFYTDLGVGPCIRVFNKSTLTGRGAGMQRPGLTYTLESHIGYYIPVMQQRLFIEAAAYFSEMGSMIYLPHVYGDADAEYRNNYTLNFQLSFGILLAKSE